MEEKKVLIIYNPNSGKREKTAYLCAKYKELLEKKGYQVTTVKTKYPNHAKTIIKNVPHYEIVFSLGGDGTLNEVIAGNMEREDKLNICPLPLGTCNDVASMLGYGKDPIENMEKAISGELHDLDIGTINDTPFIYVVGMGKFMNIPYEADGQEKKKMGYLSYIKMGVKEIIDKIKKYKAKIKIDGEEIDGNYSMIMVSNSNHIAGVNNFHKNVKLDDGEFEVLLCKSSDIVNMAINFMRYFMGLETENIISLKGHDINIQMDEQSEKAWCIDGEKLSENSRNIIIRAKTKMKILTPKGIRDKKLFN